MTRRTFILLLLGTPWWLAASRTSAADDEGFKVIVHPSHRHNSIDRDFLRRAYLKKANVWGDGTRVRPIDLPRGSAARARFTREVLRKSAAQLKSYWNQQVFSGKAVPPPEVESAADAIAYVLDHPGAIAYLPANLDPGGAKVVVLR